MVLRQGIELTDAELQAFVGEQLASFKVPTHISFTTVQLPRNASGKILKRELRDSIVAGG